MESPVVLWLSAEAIQSASNRDGWSAECPVTWGAGEEEFGDQSFLWPQSLCLCCKGTQCVVPSPPPTLLLLFLCS